MRGGRRGSASRGSDVTIGAVLPVKDLDCAKQRLSGLLSGAERRALCRAMVEDVLETLSRVSGLSGIVVVTRDAEARALAGRYRARVLDEPANDGQTAAVTRAAGALADAGVDGLLQVPGDVPAARVAEIESVLRAHGQAPAVTLVPAHDRRGTNCVLCSPPDALPFAFGGESFPRHRGAARARGIAPRIVRLPGLGLDIDAPDDLRAFLAAPVEGRTLACLRESGIAARLPVPDAA